MLWRFNEALFFVEMSKHLVLWRLAFHWISMIRMFCRKVPLSGCCSFINTIKWLSKLGFTVFPIAFLFFQKDAFFFFGFSPVVVGLFCTKTLGICTKQNIFCTKSRGNFSMSFRTFPYFLIQIPDSFVFFSWLFRRKNPFFLIRLPVNDRIYSYQPYIFHAFLG